MDNIEVKNLAPKFLKFYNLANEENITLDDRWELWKEYYGFAAVPPGEDGEKIARNLLDKAWEKYEGKMDYIKTFEPTWIVWKVILQISNRFWVAMNVLIW